MFASQFIQSREVGVEDVFSCRLGQQRNGPRVPAGHARDQRPSTAADSLGRVGAQDYQRAGIGSSPLSLLADWLPRRADAAYISDSTKSASPLYQSALAATDDIGASLKREAIRSPKPAAAYALYMYLMLDL